MCLCVSCASSMHTLISSVIRERSAVWNQPIGTEKWGQSKKQLRSGGFNVSTPWHFSVDKTGTTIERTAPPNVTVPVVLKIYLAGPSLPSQKLFIPHTRGLNTNVLNIKFLSERTTTKHTHTHTPDSFLSILVKLTSKRINKAHQNSIIIWLFWSSMPSQGLHVLLSEHTT